LIDSPEVALKRVMRRQAVDNRYFHPDFHGALSAGIEYLDRRYGSEAVREFLRRFTTTFYAPLIKKVRRGGLPALRKHFEEMYLREGGKIRMAGTKGELILEVRECPAVRHMRKRGYKVARLFRETDRTVNSELCTRTPFSAELVSYDRKTGASTTRFFRCKHAPPPISSPLRGGGGRWGGRNPSKAAR
jgi:hypothetical protein